MIADDIHGPAACRIDGRNLLAELRRRQFVHSGEHEIHGHLQLIAVLAIILLQLIDVFRPGFTNQYGAVLVGNFAQLAENVVHFRQLFVVFLVHIGIAVFVLAGKDWVVTKIGIFEQRIHGIETEASYTPLVPPAGHIEHGILHRGVAPVEVGLFAIEVVVVVLAGPWIELPG